MSDHYHVVCQCTDECQAIPDYTLPRCGHHYCKMCFLKLHVLDEYDTSASMFYQVVRCMIPSCNTRSIKMTVHSYDNQRQHQTQITNHKTQQSVEEKKWWSENDPNHGCPDDHSKESGQSEAIHNQFEDKENKHPDENPGCGRPEEKKDGKTDLVNPEQFNNQMDSNDHPSKDGKTANCLEENLPIKGLPANGMSCYFNSVLQVLAQTPGFMEQLKNLQENHGPASRTLFKILEDIISRSDNDETGSIVSEGDVDDLQKIISSKDQSFRKGLQNDCHSFLICLINCIKEELPDGALGMWEGQMKNEFSYSTCDHIEESDPQMFNTLLLPMENHKFSIEDGLMCLRRAEKYEASSIPCRFCLDKGSTYDYTVTKSNMVIEKPPEILVLQIGRFRERHGHAGYTWLEKIQDDVYYKAGVDLTDLCQSPLEEQGQVCHAYKLFGVISHQGTLQDGHYFAHVLKNSEGDKSCDNEQWYSCVNEDIRRCRKNEHLNSPDAYLMFYKHADFS